ncbi:MAG: M50 family metallopeptidase [Anaerolineae bacterium]
MLLTIVSFIFVMAVIVFVHELGHLVAAKRNGIVVEEFGFGFPPRLIKVFEHGGTVYSINAIPLGGFARMRGEDDPTKPGSFAAASRLARTVTLLAGPGMNFLLTIVLFTGLALMQGIPDMTRPATVVLQVLPDSPAAAAGLQPGDRLVTADGLPLTSDQDLIRYTASRANRPVVYTVARGEQAGKPGVILTFTITPLPNEKGEGKIGVQLARPVRSASIFEAVGLGFSAAGRLIYLTFSIPANLIREGKPISDAGFVGPVGIAVITGDVVREVQNRGSLLILVEFIAVLSTALGLTNLLPIPALDGGRLLFIAAEVIRGRRVEPAREGLIHLIGFGLLLLLMALLTVREVGALLSGNPAGLGLY